MSDAPVTIDTSVAAVLQGTATCRSNVERTFAAIKQHDAAIHAFLSHCTDRAFKRAEMLDALTASEKKQLPLLGVPVAVKDNICTKDHLTTCGSKMLEHFVPPYNATVIELLESAGAIIVGKTNMDEFAMGSSNETSWFGGTRNPRNISCIPGGSSGGSAAAVSAGFVPAALGSDTGGSIRQPCSHCGVPGIKPTYGRVSRYGLVAFASSLDQIGPIATSVSDCARLLAVLSAPDGKDSTNAHRPFTFSSDLFDGTVSHLRIGLPREYFSEGISPEVAASIDAAKAALLDRGATFVDISLPNIRYAISTYYIICTAEASSNLARYDGVKFGFRAQGGKSIVEMYELTRQQGFGQEVKRRIMLGTYVLSSGYYDAYYKKAAQVRALIRNDFDSAFTQCDCIMSPVAPTPAFRIGEKTDDPIQMYLTDIFTVSANLAGIPGISVPGRVPAGALPIGVQFMAPHWREDTLFRVGHAAEQTTR